MTERFIAKPPHINLECPECGHVFRQRRVDPLPDRCPRCLAWMNTEHPPAEVFVPEAPYIGGENAYAKSVDSVYRKMEADSIARAYEAADILQVPVSEVSDIKITNMQDPSSLRAGDKAAILPTPQSLTWGGRKAEFQNLGINAPPTTIATVGPGVGSPTVSPISNPIASPVAQGHENRVRAVVATGKRE